MADNEQKCILVVGANPCWEKHLIFDQLTLGEVNRATSVDGYAAGKGTNFCRALKCLGGKYQGRQLTFLGGDIGTGYAADMALEGLDFRAVAVHAPTRTCTNCVVNGQMTELVEPGTALDLEAVGKFLALMKENIGDAAAVAIAGSIPEGTHPALALNAALSAKNAGVPLLIDNWQVAPGILDAGVEAILKINTRELAALTGVTSIGAALEVLRTRWPKITAGITDGCNAAWLIAPGMATPEKITPPTLPKVVNPLGAGDATSAVFLERLLEGVPVREAFAQALEAGSKSCLTHKAGYFQLDEV